MKVFLIVLSLLAAFSSASAKRLKCKPVSDVTKSVPEKILETSPPTDTSTVLPTTTGRYDSLISDIVSGKKVTSKNLLNEREFVEALIRVYGMLLVERFSKIADPTVDLQERTSKLVDDVVENWLTFVKQIQGNFFEQAASVVTKANLVGLVTKYIYDIGDFSSMNYASFLLDGRISKLALLAIEANGLLDNPEMNLDNGKIRDTVEKMFDAVIEIIAN